MSVGVMEDYKLRDLRASHTVQVVYYESMKRKLKRRLLVVYGGSMFFFPENHGAPRTHGRDGLNVHFNLQDKVGAATHVLLSTVSSSALKSRTRVVLPCALVATLWSSLGVKTT